jgi:hypothetical protein
LQILQGDLFGIVDQALYFEKELISVDFRDTAVVANKEVFVGCDLGLT